MMLPLLTQIGWCLIDQITCVKTNAKQCVDRRLVQPPVFRGALSNSLTRNVYLTKKKMVFFNIFFARKLILFRKQEQNSTLHQSQSCLKCRSIVQWFHPTMPHPNSWIIPIGIFQIRTSDHY